MCDATALSQCDAGCYIAARCDEYQAIKSGAQNDLSLCLTSCEVSYGGGTTAPSCANASAKRLLCGDSSELACDDANPLDQCLNRCIIGHDCEPIDPIQRGLDRSYENCLAACEAAAGGTSPNFMVADGGYVTTFEWSGYAWTATDEASGSSILPADFAGGRRRHGATLVRGNHGTRAAKSSGPR
jgi:hypothetical protein